MSKKSSQTGTNVAIVVAIIGLAGTVITAILSSPVLLKIIESSPTETTAPSEKMTLIFSDDFEDGTASGFDFGTDIWTVAKDKSNTVLAADSTSYSPDQFMVTTFGPADFSNGVIEFKIKYEKIGGFNTAFRNQTGAQYEFYLTSSQVILGYKSQDQAWKFIPFSDNTVQSFSTQAGVWYTVRIEARGVQITVYMDGNKLFSGNDSRLQSGGLQFIMDYGTIVLLDDIKVWSFDQ